MIPSVCVDEALRMVIDALPHTPWEIVPIEESYGRILAEDCIAEENIPPFTNSAMDGYAVRTEDIAEAGAGVTLKVAGELKAAPMSDMLVAAAGTAVRIMTGAALPDGADAVVPIEDTEEDADSGTVKILRSVKKHDNVRFAGEDIRAGERILACGTRIGSAEAGILASLNMTRIKVYRSPRVAIISTGDEIVEVGEPAERGQIRNSNAFTLRGEVEKYGGIAEYLGIVSDSRQAMADIFERALRADMVISTGGVSMGRYDLVKDILAECGVSIQFESVKMKPGKPTVFGRKGRVPVFSLPGNPVSCMVAFILFVRPALLKLAGAVRLRKPEVKALLEDDIIKKPGRREFVRGTFRIHDGVIHVAKTGAQGSGILSSMHRANCLIVLPEESHGARHGDAVTIQLIDHEEID